MGHHPVGRPYAPPLNVPWPQQRLEGLDETEYRRALQGFYRLLGLGHRWDVAQIDPAGSQRMDRVRDHPPGLRKIQDDAVKQTLVCVSLNAFVRILLTHREVGNWPYIALDVLHGSPGEIFSGLIADHFTALAHGAEQRHRQRP